MQQWRKFTNLYSNQRVNEHLLTEAMKNFLLLVTALTIFSCKQAEAVSPSHCSLANGILVKDEIVCGSIRVPEDHSMPDGKKIEISYLILKSRNSDTKAFPVIYFSGGPGAPSLTKGRITNWANHPFREERDIIMFDQRGIGYSSAIPNIQAELMRVMEGDLSYGQELVAAKEIVSQFRKKCDEMDIELGNYTSFQNAADVGILMNELGYPKYNLYGGSYGTRVARIVQDKFPAKINTVILNSPAPLSGDFLVNRLKNYTKALQRVFDYCAKTPSCIKEYPDIQEEYLEALQNLSEKPILVKNQETDFYINLQDGLYLIRRMLYQNDSRTNIPKLIRAYKNGSGRSIDSIVDYELRFTGSFNASMMMAIERHEQYDPTYTTAWVDEYYSSSEMLPAPLGYFTSLYEACRDWHNNVLPESEKEFQRSAIPTLITVNQYDPVTPPEYGPLFEKTLDNSRLYILDEGGHGSGNANCKNKVMIAFMDDPFEKIDTSCLNLYKN